MTRASQQVGVFLLLTSAYLFLISGLVPVPDVIRLEILPVLPLWAIVSFGAYLLSRVGLALLFFNDVPEAYETLQKEIQMAQKELRAKGVDVD